MTRDDVLALADGGAPETADVAAPASRAGARETRIPVKGVRKMTAEAMVASAFTAPHVTEFVTVDVTRTMRLVERLRTDREFEGVKVSPLLVVARALLLSRAPQPRRQRDLGRGGRGDRRQALRQPRHRGRNARAGSSSRTSRTPTGCPCASSPTRSRRSPRRRARDAASPADMAGGTISITNVGVFGVDTGTPILNPGEAAILAFGAVRQQPWVHKGKIRARWVTQLALSFDHRLVDGDLRLARHRRRRRRPGGPEPRTRLGVGRLASPSRDPATLPVIMHFGYDRRTRRA